LILYLIARDPHGAPIHIDEWERGQAVTCFGCGEDLIGRLPFDGIKPTAHFAHKTDVACAGETALHKAAKAAITYSHANGILRVLSWECPHCKRCLHQTDLRSVVLREEVRPCEGVVSDVLGVDVLGKPCVAIEVVVTHDVEVETLERYRSLGLHVFTLRPSWGIVGDIVRGVDPLSVDYCAGLVDTLSCEGCQQVLREKAEWAARELAQKAKAWWRAWATAWGHIGREIFGCFDEQRRLLLAQRAREHLWWKVFAGVWQRIAAQIVDAWWIGWRQMWRELGLQHARPYIWQRAWHVAWEEVGKQYAADEAKRARRLADDIYRENTRCQTWWPAWIRMWTDIGQRESGVMAAWRPICRKCRQDLTRDHSCP
jgi:hypothetical protein